MKRPLPLGRAVLLLALSWLAVLLLALALPAHAEEPAFWPPCDAPNADARCPAPRPPLPGRAPPETQCYR